MQTRLPGCQALRLLWAFDFDGVVCHSAKELCITGWSAARAFWPEQTAGWPERPASPLLDSFFRVRPVVETGWEVMLINRALQEGRYDAGTILRDYTASLREQLLTEYGGHAPEDYMKVFRDVRAAWMARDEAGWLGENDFYPGALDCMRHLLTSPSSSSSASSASSPSSTPAAAAPNVYVITTKGKEFTLKLLEGAGLKGLLPESHVFGLGSGKKVDVLKALIQQHEAEAKGAADVRAVFIEDRLQTQQGVLEHPDPYVRDRSDLLLAGWGYNTAEERAAAAAHPRIELLPTEQDFLAYIQRRQQEVTAAAAGGRGDGGAASSSSS